MAAGRPSLAWRKEPPTSYFRSIQTNVNIDIRPISPYTSTVDPLMTSAEAAAFLGVGPTAVKRWADAGVLACVRTAGGHRRFARETVASFRRQHCSDAERSEWDEWIDVLTNGSDGHAVMARLFNERAQRGAWYRVAVSLGELLVEVGARWAKGDLSVVQEHIASARLQRSIAAVVESLPVAAQAPICLLATAEGDEHTLGLSLAELCLGAAGWRGQWVGHRTRPADIIERIQTSPSSMVALSASAAMSGRATLLAQVRAIGAACQDAGIPLVLGGGGAWPAPSAGVVRISGWDAFHHYLVKRPTQRRAT